MLTIELNKATDPELFLAVLEWHRPQTQADLAAAVEDYELVANGKCVWRAPGQWEWIESEVRS